MHDTPQRRQTEHRVDSTITAVQVGRYNAYCINSSIRRTVKCHSEGKIVVAGSIKRYSEYVVLKEVLLCAVLDGWHVASPVNYPWRRLQQRKKWYDILTVGVIMLQKPRDQK